MDKDKLKELVALALDEGKGTVNELRRITGGFSLKGLSGALHIAPDVIKRVEKISVAKELAGADKKELAIEIIVQLVPLPAYIPEWLERKVLGWIIDRAVARYNKK